jgi:hypothetical protein
MSFASLVVIVGIVIFKIVLKVIVCFAVFG